MFAVIDGGTSTIRIWLVFQILVSLPIRCEGCGILRAKVGK